MLDVIRVQDLQVCFMLVSLSPLTPTGVPPIKGNPLYRYYNRHTMQKSSTSVLSCSLLFSASNNIKHLGSISYRSMVSHSTLFYWSFSLINMYGHTVDNNNNSGCAFLPQTVNYSQHIPHYGKKI